VVNITKKFIFCDKCLPSVKQEIENKLYLDVITRNIDDWSIEYISSVITSPLLKVIVINNIDEVSISEIALASFMCKKILVTTKAINEYPLIYNMVSDTEPGCNFMLNNCSFVNWYNYTFRR